MIQHTHTEEMDKVRDEVAVLLEMLPIERRLAGLSVEDRLTGLSEEKLAQLRRLIDKRENGS